MRVVMLYRPKSEHEGTVLDYVHDYERFRGKKIDLISLDTIAGSNLAQLHDITQYPAVLALADDGSAQRFWQGLPLPLMNDIDQYAQLINQAELDASFAKMQFLAA